MVPFCTEVFAKLSPQQADVTKIPIVQTTRLHCNCEKTKKRKQVIEKNKSLLENKIFPEIFLSILVHRIVPSPYCHYDAISATLDAFNGVLSLAGA